MQARESIGSVRSVHQDSQDFSKPSIQQQHSTSKGSRGQQYNISCYATSSPLNGSQPAHTKISPPAAQPTVSRYSRCVCGSNMITLYKQEVLAPWKSRKAVPVLHEFCRSLVCRGTHRLEMTAQDIFLPSSQGPIHQDLHPVPAWAQQLFWKERSCKGCGSKRAATQNSCSFAGSR